MTRFARYRLLLVALLIGGSLAAGPLASAATPRVLVCSAVGKVRNIFAGGGSAQGGWGVRVSGNGTCADSSSLRTFVSLYGESGSACLDLNVPCADWSAVVRVTLIDSVTGATTVKKQVWRGVPLRTEAVFAVSKRGTSQPSGAGAMFTTGEGVDKCPAPDDLSCIVYPARFLWTFTI